MPNFSPNFQITQTVVLAFHWMITASNPSKFRANPLTHNAPEQPDTFTTNAAKYLCIKGVIAQFSLQIYYPIPDQNPSNIATLKIGRQFMSSFFDVPVFARLEALWMLDFC